MLEVVLHRDEDHSHLSESAKLIAAKVLSGKHGLVAFEGLPGAGKSNLSKRVGALLESSGVPVSRAWGCTPSEGNWSQTGIETEFSTLPRVERRSFDHPGVEYPEFHTGEIVAEAIHAHTDPRLNPKGLSFRAPNLYHHGVHQTAWIRVPREAGILLIEGVSSIDMVLRELTRYRSETHTRALLVLLDHSLELIEDRRRKRDATKLNPPTQEEIEWRIQSQRGVFESQMQDMRKFLSKTRAGGIKHRSSELKWAA